MRTAPGEARLEVLTCPGKGSDCCSSPCWQAELDSHPTTARGYSPGDFHHKQLWLPAAKVIKGFLCEHLRRQVWCQTKLQSGRAFLPSETKSRGIKAELGKEMEAAKYSNNAFSKKMKKKNNTKTKTRMACLALLARPWMLLSSCSLKVLLEDCPFSHSEQFPCLAPQRLQKDAACSDLRENCWWSFDSRCFSG